MKIYKIKAGNANGYILEGENELAIIDPGQNLTKIMAELQKFKKPLKCIILTHYHFDHTDAAQKLKEKTGAPILAHEKEKDYLLFDIDQKLKDGSEIKLGKERLKVGHYPGHSAGSICLFTDGEAFCGDIVFERGYGRADLPGGSPLLQAESIKKIRRQFKKGTTIYPGHGESFKA